MKQLEPISTPLAITLLEEIVVSSPMVTFFPITAPFSIKTSFPNLTLASISSSIAKLVVD